MDVGFGDQLRRITASLKVPRERRVHELRISGRGALIDAARAGLVSTRAKLQLGHLAADSVGGRPGPDLIGWPVLRAGQDVRTGHAQLSGGDGLRFARNDRGQSLVEAGIDRIPGTSGRRTVVGALAVIGAVSTALLLSAVLAVAASLYSRTPDDLPSYILLPADRIIDPRDLSA